MKTWLRYSPFALVIALASSMGCDGSTAVTPRRDSGAKDGRADSSSTVPGDVRADAPSGPDAADRSDLAETGPDTSADMRGGLDAGVASETRSTTDSAADSFAGVDTAHDSSVRLDTLDSSADRSGQPEAGAEAGVEAGVEAGAEAGAAAPWTLNMLGYRVLDAEYSAALEAIVFVTDSPDRALHVYNPGNKSDARVALPLGAVAVSVSPDGEKAVVAHDAHVTYVDLVLGAVIKTCDVASDAIDVVLAGNGWAYVFPMTDQWSAIHGIKLDSCSETPSGGWSIYAGTVAKLHPSGTKMYGADRGLSPSDIERYDLGSGPPVYGYDSPYHGDYPMCGNLWISSDGLRIFTACGRVFRASDTRSEDMTYNGRLESAESIRHLSHATARAKVLVIPSAATSYPANPDGDTSLRIHDYQYLTLDRSVPLPSIPGSGTAVFKAHGRFAFAKSDGSAYYVVLQADASSGLLNDFAVATMAP